MSANRMLPRNAPKKKAQRWGWAWAKLGADERNRTVDLRITNALLYQLSYTGAGTAKAFAF